MTQYDPNAVQAGQNTRRGCGWMLALIVLVLLVLFIAGLVTGLGDDMVTAGKNVGNNIAGLFNPTNEEPTQAEQPATADEPVVEQPQAEQPAMAIPQSNLAIQEVAVDWNEGAFGDSLFDHAAQPTLTLLPGHGAIFSADPSDFYLDGVFAFGGKVSNQGLVAYVYNDSDSPVEILVNIDYYNSTWRRPDGQLGRWSVHTVVFSGTFDQIEAEANKLQYSENKPLYFTVYAAPNTEPTVTPTAQATQPAIVPTSVPTVQPTAQPTAAPTVCNKTNGTGPVWISSDPATVNGTQVSTRFTLVVSAGVSYNITGVSENNMTIVCNPDDSYMVNFDKAPTRVSIDSDGNVNVSAASNQ